MSQVVEARCPRCENVLRIPREWLSRTMRCKHCQHTFAAQTKTAANVPIAMPANKLAAPVAVAKPAYAVTAAAPSPVAIAAPVGLPPKPAAKSPFAGSPDDSSDSMPSVSIRRKNQGRGMLILVGMFFFLFIFAASAVSYFGYQFYKDMMGGEQVAKVNIEREVPKAKDGTVKPPVIEPPVNNDDGPKKKRTPPVRKDQAKDAVAKDGGPKKFAGNDPFPRRALLISVNNYLMWSTVHYGSAPDPGRKYPGSNTAELRRRFTVPPMNFPATQVYELSDAIPAEYKGVKAHSTQKSVLEMTISEFLDTSRAQDRIVLFYAGHAANIDNVSYLVPIDGNKKDVSTLLPLKWVFDQLKTCKAQQKILILDVFRYSPSRGLELPSPGEGEEGQMPEGFDKDLLSPPAGVQVWSSCIKGQSAVELEEGSAFSQALCNSLQGGGKMTGISTQTQPIQVEALMTDVNQLMDGLLKGEKRTQVSRLTGTVGTRDVAFDPAEALPNTLTLKPPSAVGGGKAAPMAAVEKILEELRIMPPVRETRAGDVNLLRAQNLPAFSAEKLDFYKTDGYQNVFELQKKYKATATEFAKEFPLRAAYFETLEALEASRKSVQLREVLRKDENSPTKKAMFLKEQEPLGLSIFALQEALANMEDAKGKREMETSMRWQANFDFMHARLLSRLTYLYEYNFTLGKIRADALPDLVGNQSGWRVGIAGAKITVTEPKAKGYQANLKKLWVKIEESYQGTPWELLAQRESQFALGLEWRGKSD